MGLRIIRQEDLDAGSSHGLGVQRIAEITHLPTGSAGSSMQTVNIPPGGPAAAYQASPDDAVLHVVTGNGTLSSGSAPESAVAAGPGDTVLVPAGIAFQARNDSAVDALQFILVRGN
jgi:uncharacterized RmlC-like cupin family protein